MSVLRATGLAAGYRHRRRERRVLADLDLTLAEGRLVCLLGPNGSGKSTLLRTLAGMQAPLAGRVEIDGHDVARLHPRERARLLGVVLTDPVEVGMLRAADLVALGRHPHTDWTGRLSDADRAAVADALAAVGATALAAREVAELSDGERQRVLVARALAQQPRVLALDEPLAFVDVPRRVELTLVLRDLARQRGLAVLMTTHDVDLALRGADEVWLVEPRADGHARLHVGAPEDLALSGAIAAAFRAEAVRFDTYRATFVPAGEPGGLARVHGDGEAAVWAVRALERERYRLAGPGEHTDVEVTVCDSGWRLRAGAATSTHATLGALVGALRAVAARAEGNAAHSRDAEASGDAAQAIQ